jgi:hypothetical protein
VTDKSQFISNVVIEPSSAALLTFDPAKIQIQIGDSSTTFRIGADPNTVPQVYWFYLSVTAVTGPVIMT